jgi:tRNA-splicing ligase RtcB
MRTRGSHRRQGSRSSRSRTELRDQPVCVERIDEVRWRIPRGQRPAMRVDGLVFADEGLMAAIRGDPALEQVVNVATLPGIVGASLAMADVHWGYGFPIGGVAAVRREGGVISPGGIGFDINGGVRLIRSNLTRAELAPRLESLADALYSGVPSGLGASIGHRLSAIELNAVLLRGASWAVEHDRGWAEDLERTEELGRLGGADPSQVSALAHQRGADQLGTLGSGNHFLEVDEVDEIYDTGGAAALGLFRTQVVAFIHCGSRGLGHQVCTDHVAVMDRSMRRYGFEVPDRQLACAPIESRRAGPTSARWQLQRTSRGPTGSPSAMRCDALLSGSSGRTPGAWGWISSTT